MRLRTVPWRVGTPPTGGFTGGGTTGSTRPTPQAGGGTTVESTADQLKKSGLKLKQGDTKQMGHEKLRQLIHLFDRHYLYILSIQFYLSY